MLVDKNGNEVTINDVRRVEFDLDAATKKLNSLIIELENSDSYDEELIERTESELFEFYACGCKARNQVKELLDAEYAYVRKYPSVPYYVTILSNYVQLNLGYNNTIHADICTEAYRDIINGIQDNAIVIDETFLSSINNFSFLFILDGVSNSDEDWFDYIYRQFKEGSLDSCPDFLKAYLELIKLYYSTEKTFNYIDANYYNEHFQVNKICEMAHAVYSDEEYNNFYLSLEAGYIADIRKLHSLKK